VKIKDISGIGFSSRGSSQKKGHLSISDSLFRKIIIDDQTVSSGISEIFSNGTGGIRGQELKRGSFRSSSSKNDGIRHSSIVS
jgi:hypothetical protein